MRFILPFPWLVHKSFLYICIPLVVLQTGPTVPFSGFHLYLFVYDICFSLSGRLHSGWWLQVHLPHHLLKWREGSKESPGHWALIYDSFLLLLAFFSHDLIFSKVTLPKCSKWNYVFADHTPSSVMNHVLVITQASLTVRQEASHWLNKAFYLSSQSYVKYEVWERIHLNTLPFV